MEIKSNKTDYVETRLERLFEVSVAEHPELCAIKGPDGELSYAELNENSNRIAHCLNAHDLNNNGAVVTLLQSNIRQIESLFGILKADCHFICLDPCHPSERLIGILKEVIASTIIVDESVFRHPKLVDYILQLDVKIFSVDILPEKSNGLKETIPLDKQLENFSIENPTHCGKPMDIAYIAYTSGSTGKPKGIVQSHRSFCQFLKWQAKEFDIGPNKLFIQWASISYDASFCEIFGTLCFAGTLCVESAEVRFNPLLLVQWLRQVQPHILQIVPSFCRQVIEVLQDEKYDTDLIFSNLEYLMLAGEALPTDLAASWKALQNNHIYNLYGPSESVLATYHKFIEQDMLCTMVPIGKPIDGRQILILDELQKSVPIGQTGELYIRSQYLTLGYLNRKQETAQRFIQNPLNKQSEQSEMTDSVFRTGDMVRLRNDGELEFIGRQDNLVKLRGMRVELGEIEAVIRKQVNILECVVQVCSIERQQDRLTAKDRKARHTVAAGSQFLVAYITTSEPIEPSVLRTAIRKSLPVHMVPQQFILLDAMPMNANHKLDKKALPKPEKSRPEIDIPFAPPTTEMQQQLKEIWCSVLGFDELGINDPFLDLGGDSLLGMQIVNRVSKQLNRKLSAITLMQNSNIKQLENHILENQEIDQRKALLVQKYKPARIPLSHAQWGLWYLWKLDPNNPFYTAQGSVHLEGILCRQSLNRAWQHTLQSHEVLRTRFVMQDGEPAQIFSDYSAEQINYLDLSHLNETESLKEMDRINTQLGKHAYHLENDHLLQVQLFKLSEQHHEFVFTYQEIIFDLWGFAIIIRDLLECYAKIKANGNLDLKADNQPGRIEFSDFCLWEKENINQQKLQLEESFWREHLAGQLPVLDLPFDYPRKAEPDYAGDAKSFMLDADSSRKLKQLSRNHGVTLFTTILSAFYIFLRQYSNQQDIIIGTPIANRARAGTEDVVGWFLNMLPIRLNADDEITFEELLNQSNQVTTNAITNADYPFRWMLEWANTPRDKSISPVFQVMFNWQNLPQTAPEIEGLQVSSSEVDSTFKKYDLALYAQEHLDRIYLQFSYLTTLFKPSKIKRMLDNFVLTVETLCDNPQQKISQVGQINPTEKHWLINQINDTHINRDSQLGVATLFEEQVIKSPTTSALLFEGHQVSYKQLNHRANKIANYLKNRGLKSKTRITICLKRTPDMIAALLAVSKLGAIHVALDSNFPTTRLNEVILDVDASAHICQKSTDTLAINCSVKLCLDKNAADIELSSDKNLNIQSCLDDIFNIVYTSATTGKSKGLMIPNRAVINRLIWMWSKYPFVVGDIAVLQKSYAIVASNWEILGALLSGHPTLILSRDEVLDGSAFYRQCYLNNVSHLLASPALLSNVLNQAEQNTGAVWQSLKFATSSAESLSAEMVSRWRAQFPQVPLLNLFGATECSSNATCFDTAELTERAQNVPIGRPIDNTKVYILDQQLNLMPQGATGELCVAGDCLAREYFNLPEINKKTFVTNPYAKYASATKDPAKTNRYTNLCRTGDLARINEKGQLELVGRKDLQVKVRGFRVELGDLECVLMEHPEVNKCIATTYQGAGDLIALAVFVETDKSELTASLLRNYLSERVPDYMLPAQIKFVDEIPLTASGKPDRAALPEVETQQRVETIIAPRTSAEKVVLDVWSRVLEVEHLGIEDDFFDLGGHSLLATEMVRRLLDIFQIELPIRSIFDAPTVGKLVNGPLTDMLGDLQLVEEVADIWLSIESQD